MRYIGLDIGGTKCAVSLGEPAKDTVRIAERREIATPERWQDALDTLFSLAQTMLSGTVPDACGISCGGPLDWRDGVVLSPPNLPTWDHVPVTRLAQEALGAPAFLENDANACALAEWRWGAGRGAENMAFLTFGTGLGAGLILDNRLVRGATGDAGEIGHIRMRAFGPSGYGKEGSLEGFCSGGGIAQLADTLARRALQRGAAPSYWQGGASVTTRQVADAARAGDETARAVFALSGSVLGEGLATLVDLVNPDVIVIGSIYARCRDLLEAPMWESLCREALPNSLRRLSVLPAALGERIGDCAALCVAEYGLMRA